MKPNKNNPNFLMFLDKLNLVKKGTNMFCNLVNGLNLDEITSLTNCNFDKILKNGSSNQMVS